MFNRPEHVVLKCSKAIINFRSVITDLNMPPFNLEETMKEMAEALTVLDDEDHELKLTAFEFSETDALFESYCIEEPDKNRIFEAVMTLGTELKQELNSHQGYDQDGTFPYELKALLNNDTLVFKRKLE